MKKRIIFTVLIISAVMCFTSFAAGTYSEFWKQDSAGNWYVQKPDGSKVTNAWLCDDAVPANGKEVWYLLDGNGQMISAGLVQDGTGSFYSIETEHNGYYGMLRYKSGNYGGVNLTLEGSHNGAFAAILNADGIEALKAKYGLTSVANISNANCVYTSSFGKSSAVTGGGTSGGSGSGSVSGGGSTNSSSSSGAGAYTTIGGPTRIAPTGERYSGRFVVSKTKWAEIMGMSVETVSEYLQGSPKAKYYYTMANGKKSEYGFSYTYSMNGETLVAGRDTPNIGNEGGEWIVDNTKQDSMYGKTNIRFRYPDGNYAGYGWHSGTVDKAYSDDCVYRFYNDPEYQKYTGKASYFFTEDGYLVRNTIVNSEVSWVGEDIKVGYDGSWIDRDY